MTLSYKIPSILLSNIDRGIIPYSMNGDYSNQIQPVFHRMTDSNAAQFSNNQVWWAQTPLPKISSQSISGRLKFCCETYFRGFTFFGYVLALAVVFRTRIHENPRDAAQLRMFDWFIWIFCGQCCQMAQHFANHMFAEHHLEFPIGCTISYVAPFSHGYYWPLPRAGQIRCAKFVQ